MEAIGVKLGGRTIPRNRPISSAYKRKAKRKRKLPKQRLLIAFEGGTPKLLKIKNDANRRLTGKLAAQQGYLRCAAEDPKFPQNTYGANTRALHIRRLNQKTKQLR